MPARGLLLRFSSLGLRSHQLQQTCLRTFLSDAYKCESEWQGRVNTPLLSKLKNENLYADLLKKFTNEGKVTAIDVDLFSNLVTNEHHLEDLEDITHKFRRCPNTIHALPSTGHAVVRTYLDFKSTNTLMRMLDDRLNYGLFLDYYLSNVLMDVYLKAENYRDAAKIAIQLMLQEEFDHPITSHLALYSCYSYLKKPQPEIWDPQPKPKAEEPVEEVKVRVEYLREPFFDDHFDLTKPEQLIGKTLVGFGKHLASKSTDPLAQSSILLGWSLFEKQDKVIQTLDNILKSPKTGVFRECLELCRKKLGELPQGFMDNFNSRVNELEKAGVIVDGDVLEIVKQRTKEVVAQHEQSDIQAQLDRYKKWDQLRQEEVQKQIEAIEYRKRLAVLEAKKKELQEKEEKLNFFENIDEWELRYEEKELQRQQKTKELESHSKKISAKMLRQAEEDAYFPPEMNAQRGAPK